MRAPFPDVLNHAVHLILLEQPGKGMQNKQPEGWGCASVVEHTLSMYEALGLTLSAVLAHTSRLETRLNGVYLGG